MVSSSPGALARTPWVAGLLALLVLALAGAASAAARAQDGAAVPGSSVPDTAEPDTAEGADALVEESGTASSHEAASVAYRLGDHASADTLWREALGRADSAAERARLCTNLGNNAFRSQRPREAVGWYRAALHHAPRDDRAAANLEFVLSELGEPPRDAGNLGFALGHLALGWSAVQARWIAALGLALLALCLAGEALRGGGGWQLACLGAGLLALLSFLPLVGRALWDEDGALVVSEGALPAYSEPRTDSQRLFLLHSLDTVRVLDELPGWTQVRHGGDRPVWVRADAVFPLDR